MRRSRRTAAHDDGLLWLFDLDNTLHDTSHAIFPRIDHGMTMAVAETLGVDIDTANHLRRKYWKRYGATMIGLVRHHGVDPHEFLHRSHDFDVNPLVRAEKALAYKLRQLPGRKVLLTNAPLEYARAVLRRLGILRQFDSLWAIEHMRLHGEFRPAVAGPAALRAGARGRVAPPHRAGRGHAGQSARRAPRRPAHGSRLSSRHAVRTRPLATAVVRRLAGKLGQ